MAREEAEIKELTKKLEQNPDSMVFVQLADAWRRTGDLDKCIEVCLQGLERHPTYATARTILGRAYLDKGKLDESIAEFKKIEASDPENVVAQRMLGQVLMKKGLYGEAISRHQKVLALDPDDHAAQELLQEALLKAKGEGAKAPAGQDGPEGHAAAQGATSEQLGTIKVAEIYIKKGAFDEAIEVLSEILSSDPGNSLARQKLKEIEEKKSGKASAAAEEAKAQKAAEEEAKRAAAAAAAAEKEKAAKAAESAAAAKRAAEEEARKKEEAARKAAETAAAEKKAADEKRRKEEEARKAEEEKKKQDEAKKKGGLNSDDILSVMAAGDDDLVGESESAPAAAKAQPAAAAAPAAAKGGGKLEAAAAQHLADFAQKNAIEAHLLVERGGAVLANAMPGNADIKVLSGVASDIFSNTEKAAQRMRFGLLQQVIISAEDGRQAILVGLKAGVLVALTGKSTNLGLLRIAINDLMKKV